MLTKYNKFKVTRILDNHYPIRDIVSKSSASNQICPYDKLVLYTEYPVSNNIKQLVSKAAYVDKTVSVDEQKKSYKFMLNYKLFNIKWGKPNKSSPNTIITINPSKQNLSPSAVVDLLILIVGDIERIYVGGWDEKVDIKRYKAQEVVRHLYVPNQRSKPEDFENKHETYYFGKRNGRQVKVYNKAKERGEEGYALTRIEKTNKLERSKRPSLRDFFFGERADIFKGMTMVDIDKLDGRSRLKRLIKKENTMVGALRKSEHKDRIRLQRESAFMHPIINLQQQFQEDLDRWLAHRSLLNLKIISISLAEIWRERSPHNKAEIDPVLPGSVFPGVSLSEWLGQSKLCEEVNIEYEYYSPMEL